MNDNNSAVQTELPEIIEVNGVTYERVDYENHYAVKLIRLIKRIAQQTGCTEGQAAWAVVSPGTPPYPEY